jgi:transposase-like protein
MSELSPNARRGATQRGKPKPKRPYSEDDKATALALLKANGNNCLLTSRQTGIPNETLRRWSNGEHISRDVPGKRDAKQEQLGDIFERITRKYLEHAEKSGTISKVRGRDAVIAACASADKMRLLREQPTSIRAADGEFGPPIRVIIVPAATDPGGRVYGPEEVKELCAGLGEPASSGSTDADVEALTKRSS